ncbi:histone-lysine N-methyltransferase SETMAR [Trichonephila clavipes]|nr:histone-lysine N-methyltransferase SETMAR [Trichonephila clavipes]
MGERQNSRGTRKMPIYSWVEFEQMDSEKVAWTQGRCYHRISYLVKPVPGLLRWGVLLLEDTTRPHSVSEIQNHIATLGWERLHHPPYSPHLAPSHFNLFLAAKMNLARRRSGSNSEVKQAVKRFFRMQSPEF